MMGNFFTLLLSSGDFSKFIFENNYFKNTIIVFQIFVNYFQQFIRGSLRENLSSELLKPACSATEASLNIENLHV